VEKVFLLGERDETSAKALARDGGNSPNAGKGSAADRRKKISAIDERGNLKGEEKDGRQFEKGEKEGTCPLSKKRSCERKDGRRGEIACEGLVTTPGRGGGPCQAGHSKEEKGPFCWVFGGGGCWWLVWSSRGEERKKVVFLREMGNSQEGVFTSSTVGMPPISTSVK